MVERTQVLVIGAGPAGLAAAGTAAASGANVVLIDENPAAGGQIWRADRGRPARESERWIEATQRVDYRVATTVVDITRERCTLYDGNRVYDVAADTTVLCTGARELFLPIPGWTRPGVFGVGGLQALCKQGFDVRGRSVLLAGSGPLLLAVATSLRQRGAEVRAILEQAPRHRVLGFAAGLWSQPGKLAQALRYKSVLRGVPQRFGDWPVAIEDGVVRTRRGDSWSTDLVALGFGLVPETRLARLLGCAIADGAIIVDSAQGTTIPGVLAAGEPTGIGGVDKALLEGEVAGNRAAGREDLVRRLRPRLARARRFTNRLAATFALAPELRELPRDDTIVCRCEDVTWERLRTSATMRGAKLHTRCGMGPCQGRICGPALHFLMGLDAERPRPPLVPIELGTLTTQR